MGLVVEVFLGPRMPARVSGFHSRNNGESPKGPFSSLSALGVWRQTADQNPRGAQVIPPEGTLIPPDQFC
jgi:hypothetical protein